MPDSSAIKTGEGFVVMGMDLGPLQEGMKQAQAKLQAWGKGVMAAGTGIAAIGASITAPFLYGLSLFGEAANEITETSRMTNMSLSEVQGVMNGLRVGADELQPAMKKMDAFLASAAQGAPEAMEELHRMKLSLADLSKMTEAERLMAFADGIQQIGDAAQRTNAQVKVFGRGGLKMNITGGSAGIGERANRAAEIGGILSDNDVALGKEFSRTVSELGSAVKGLWMQIGAAAAPTMIWFNRLITDIVITVRKWAEENRPLLTTIFNIADKVVMVGTVIGLAGAAIFGLGTAFGILASIIGAVGAVIGAVFSPVGLIVAGIAIGLVVFAAELYGIYYLLTQFDTGRAILAGIGEYFSAWGPILESFAATFMQVWGGISDAIGAGDFGLAWDITVTGMQLVWAKVVNWMTDSWLAFKYLFVANFGEAYNQIVNIIADIAQAFGRGIAFMIDSMITTINAAISALPDWVTSSAGIGTINFSARGASDAAVATMRDSLTAPTERQAAAERTNAQGQARELEGGLQARLDALTGGAADARNLADMQRWFDSEGAGGAHGTGLTMEAHSLGTFSASAIAGMMGGSDPIDRVAEIATRQENLQQQMLEIQRQQLAAFQRGFQWR